MCQCIRNCETWIVVPYSNEIQQVFLDFPLENVHRNLMWCTYVLQCLYAVSIPWWPAYFRYFLRQLTMYKRQMLTEKKNCQKTENTLATKECFRFWRWKFPWKPKYSPIVERGSVPTTVWLYHPSKYNDLVVCLKMNFGNWTDIFFRFISFIVNI